ncbi:uncharacterized protein LOC100907592 [Galendromus occidentalis]|uniref:Uncharacterized protein LOC100907592 n=1 Tax=Galendromus occidentalis TaxID=34638 RepID=A0AAJ6VVY8_9ACAR|nr:uncharacterized protein LOC100907592 [Galendromus occidentalis]
MNSGHMQMGIIARELVAQEQREKEWKETHIEGKAEEVRTADQQHDLKITVCNSCGHRGKAPPSPPPQPAVSPSQKDGLLLHPMIKVKGKTIPFTKSTWVSEMVKSLEDRRGSDQSSSSSEESLPKLTSVVLSNHPCRTQESAAGLKRCISNSKSMENLSSKFR